MATEPITLKDEHESFIQEAVSSGAYGTRNDVVATALEVLKTQELLRKARREELKGEIQKGIDQLRRGETADFTAEDIKRLGRERLAKQTGL